MAVILWAMGLSLLMQGHLCSVGQIDKGCMKWSLQGNEVCCDICHPGNRLVKRCGPRPQELCTPCGPNTFTVKPIFPRCTQCTQCVGALVLVKECTATNDTRCGCKEGLTCGNDQCTFCVKTCDKGQEPTEKRSCRTCQHGTFNDQIHQKCKPWSTKCPIPGQTIVAKGDALTDIKCDDFPLSSPMNTNHTDQTTWPLVLAVLPISMVLVVFFIIIIIVMNIKIQQKKKTKKTITKTQIIRTPTDDPRTLIAIECSFHEAEQEQGSSSESLASSESSKQLIG